MRFTDLPYEILLKVFCDPALRYIPHRTAEDGSDLLAAGDHPDLPWSSAWGDYEALDFFWRTRLSSAFLLICKACLPPAQEALQMHLVMSTHAGPPADILFSSVRTLSCAPTSTHLLLRTVRIARHCPHLQALSLESHIPDPVMRDTLEMMAPLHHLRHLQVDRITQTSLSCLLSRCPSLNSLTVGAFRPDDCFRDRAVLANDLRYLRVNDTSPAMVVLCEWRCPKLEQLHIAYAEPVNDPASYLTWIQGFGPTLRRLTLGVRLPSLLIHNSVDWNLPQLECLSLGGGPLPTSPNMAGMVRISMKGLVVPPCHTLRIERSLELESCNLLAEVMRLELGLRALSIEVADCWSSRMQWRHAWADLSRHCQTRQIDLQSNIPAILADRLPSL